MSGDYIKLSRKILEWEWYKNVNTKVLFLHCLLKANWKDGKFEGTTVPRGSFISSITKLSEETKLTSRQVRTSIEHLKKTGELTVKTTNKYSIFTINNYCLYQEIGTQNDIQTTFKRQTNDIQTTTIEEKKERKKGINKETPKGVKKFTPPTEEQVSEYCREKGFSLDVDRFIDYYAANGWMVGKNKMKDWKAVVRNWERQGRTTKPSNQPTANKFNNFEQRTYDYAELEKELLGVEKGYES